MRVLTVDEILGVYDAAIAVGLADRRDVLLSGTSKELSASIADVTSVAGRGSQLLMDLHACNEPLLDGTLPIELWLKNALRIAPLRQETEIFKRMLRNIGADPAKEWQQRSRRSEPDSTRGSTRLGLQALRGSFWLGLAAILGALALTALIAYLLLVRGPVERSPNPPQLATTTAPIAPPPALTAPSAVTPTARNNRGGPPPVVTAQPTVTPTTTPQPPPAATPISPREPTPRLAVCSATAAGCSTVQGGWVSTIPSCGADGLLKGDWADSCGMGQITETESVNPCVPLRHHRVVQCSR